MGIGWRGTACGIWAAFLLSTSLACAQDSLDFIRPYLFQLGGSGSLYSQVNRPNGGTGAPAQSYLGFELAPRFGYVFSYSYSAGADMLLNYGLREDNFTSAGAPVRVRQETTSFSIVPDLTYYLPVVPRLYATAQLGGGYTIGNRIARQVDPTNNTIERTFKYQSNGPVAQLSAGILYFVRPVLALQVQGTYRVSWENLRVDGEPLRPEDLVPVPGLYENSRLMVRLGFQLYLRITKKDDPGKRETESSQGPGRKPERRRKARLKAKEAQEKVEEKAKDAQKTEEKKEKEDTKKAKE